MVDLIFNGINGATGDYDLLPQSAQVMAKIARGVPLDSDEKRDISIRRALDQQQVEHFGIKEGADPTDISQSGWGVVFSKNLGSTDLEALKEALDPLLKYRQEQATKTDDRFYRECSGEFGYQPGSSKNDFLNESHFGDPAHMNSAGRQVFTTRFAEDLIKIISTEENH